MLIVATKCALCAISIRPMSSMSKDLALMRQFAISNNKYLYINLRYSLINTNFMLITNNDRNILYNRISYYIQLKERRYIDEHLRFPKILTTSTIFIFILQLKRLETFESILRDNVNNEENVKNNKNNLNNT